MQTYEINVAKWTDLLIDPQDTYVVVENGIMIGRADSFRAACWYAVENGGKVQKNSWLEHFNQPEFDCAHLPLAGAAPAWFHPEIPEHIYFA